MTNREIAARLYVSTRTVETHVDHILCAGRMHHIGVGASNAHRRVLAIADQTSVTVIDLLTGEVLSTHTIDPDRSYWRNQQKRPGRWPGRNQSLDSSVAHDPTHHRSWISAPEPSSSLGPTREGCLHVSRVKKVAGFRLVQRWGWSGWRGRDVPPGAGSRTAPRVV